MIVRRKSKDVYDINRIYLCEIMCLILYICVERDERMISSVFKIRNMSHVAGERIMTSYCGKVMRSFLCKIMS